MRRVTVRVDPPYDVVVGPGALDALATVLHGRARVGVVTQRSLLPYWDEVKSALAEAGARPMLVEIEDGETTKSLQTVERICDELAAGGLLRGDALVALGGGVVGDTAGFAAAVYHRGIDVIQVPTTLLAQVDAAVGGKTAVNLPAGKNLLGAFHQPRAVVADVDTLTTLPDREYRAGLGEVAKYAFLPEGERVAKLLTDRAERILARDLEVVADVVAECVAVKAIYVETDPEERTGRRAFLNYGHTFAHALEAVSGFDLYHGEAVGIGLVFAGQLAGALERIDAEQVDRHRDLVASLELPVAVPEQARAGDLLTVMARDKKSRGGVSFVLAGPRGLELVDDPPAPALQRAFAAVGVEG